MRQGRCIEPSYDAIGNIATRTEAGVANTYLYNTSGAGSQRPHAVAGVTGSVNGVWMPQYRYDINGNLETGANRTIAWTSFDKVSSAAASGKEVRFVYDAEHERALERYFAGGALQRTTVYIHPGSGAGLWYEEETGAAGTKMKHYISADQGAFAVIVCTANPCTDANNSSTQYWHKDQLGSVYATSNAAQAIERLAFEPFGKRRYSNGPTDTWGQLGPTNTDRGFTGHEHIDELGLINMNGRIYDPALGRFLSADPNVTYPEDMASYNRYSYVLNRPLGLTDPSGYDPWFTENSAGKSSGVNYTAGLWSFGSLNSSLNSASNYFGTVNLSFGQPVGGYGQFSSLSGNLSCYSCGMVWADPMAGFGGGYYQQSLYGVGVGGLGIGGGDRLGASGVAITGTIGLTPANFFNDTLVGRILGNIAAPLALFTENNVNPLTRRIENFSGDKTAEAAIGLMTFGIGGGVRAETAVAKELVVAAKGITYNGITGPGPLGSKVASTFRSGTYTELISSEATTLYRVWGGKAGELGPYWTRTPPSGPVQSVLDSALNPAWGNTATSVTRIQVPSGVRIYEGVAAPQGGLVGGGSQVFIPKVDPAWIVR
jgi:RHS repeat-associated protein